MANKTHTRQTAARPQPVTIRKVGNQAAYVRAPLSLIRRIAKDPLDIPSHTHDPRLHDGNAILTANYSKLYYVGRMEDGENKDGTPRMTSGWWYLVGYSYDGSDVAPLLRTLQSN